MSLDVVGAEKGSGAAWRAAARWVWAVVGPFLGLLLITALFAAWTRAEGQFLTVNNWRTIAVQSVITGTAAVGMTAVMIAGGIDLSVGSAAALVTVVIAVAVRDWGLSLLPAMGLGVAVAGLGGLVNGALITGLGVVPFIITLGTLKAYRGLAKLLAGNTAVYLPSRVQAQARWLRKLLATTPDPPWLIVSPGVWMLLILSLVMALMLRRSLFGRYLYAVGSNEATARLCGISVPAVKLAVYALAGLATGLAGVLQFAYLNGTGDPVTADGLELQVIAAVVIGGGSLAGGEGTVLGSLIGCLIISVLGNGCVHAGIPNAAQDVIIGGIIVAAVILDQFRRDPRGMRERLRVVGRPLRAIGRLLGGLGR